MISLTVITSVLNGARFLDRMLASMERTADIEHIVIDAGSEDGTLDKLRRYQPTVLREIPGISLYDAWNHGLAIARGEAVLFLNADDWLPDGALAAWRDALRVHETADIIQARARAYVETPDGGVAPHLQYALANDHLDLQELTIGACIINAKLIRRRVFERIGVFDPSCSIAADREFLLRAALLKPALRCESLDRLAYCYLIHPGSLTLVTSPSRRAAVAEQHLSIADRMLATPQPPATVALLRAWQARELLAYAGAQLRQGQIAASLRTSGRLAAKPQIWRDLLHARSIRRRYVSTVQTLPAQT